MVNKDYDFRISQSACRRALTAYKDMEVRMNNVGEQIREHFNLPELHWEGKFREITQAAIFRFLKDGFYFKSLEKVKNMRICLEEALPQINELLARCEGFIDQLQSTFYVEPVKPAEDDNTERNGGILSLNYDYISKITEACDSILEENTALTEVLSNVIDDCGFLLDGTEEDLRALEKASYKLKRIGNFKKSFSLFARGVQELDVHMMLQLKTIFGSESTAINGLSKEETDLTAAHFTDYDNISVVRKFAEQIFEKDVDEWSEAEIDFIARTWDYAVQNGQKSLIEMYTREMFVEEYTNAEPIGQLTLSATYLDRTWRWDYQVTVDTEKIDLIMGNLDPQTQGEAYYTLKRIKNMKFEPVTIEERVIGGGTPTPKWGAYNLDVSQNEEGKIHMIFSAGSYNMSNDINVNEQYELTVYDLQKINSKKFVNLGFSNEQIEEMRLRAVTDADISMLQELSDGNYEAAFLIDPSELSEGTKVSLTWIANQIVLTAAGEGNSTDDVIDFINAILHTSPERCRAMGNDTIDNYLDILGSTSMMLLDYEIELCKPVLSDNTPSIELEKLKNEWRNLYVLYGLWFMLKESTNSEYFNNLDSDYYYGIYTYKIDKLEFGKDGKEFSGIKMELGVYTQDGEITVHMIEDDSPVNQVREIMIDADETPSQVNTQLSRVKRQELYDDMELEKAEALFDAAVSCLKAMPEIEVTLKGLKSFYKGDIVGVLSNGGEITDNIMGEQNTYGTIIPLPTYILRYNQIMEDLNKKLRENENAYIITSMGSGVSGSVDKKEFSVSYAIYNPYIIARLNTWSEQGLYGLLGIEASAEEKSRKLNNLARTIGYPEDSVKHDNFLRKYKTGTVDIDKLETCLKLLLYGNDFDGDGKIDCEKKIYEMDTAVLIEAIRLIDSNTSFVEDDLSAGEDIFDILQGNSCLDFLDERHLPKGEGEKSEKK